MEKRILRFKVAEQELSTVTGSAYFASNIVDYLEAYFELGANWSGFDSVRAVWFTDFCKIATVLQINGSVGKCIVPHEVLKRAQKVKVNLVGSKAENDVLTERLTTYPIIAIVIDANARADGDNTQPITPSQFEQFVAAVQDSVAEIKDIDRIVLNSDYTLTFYYSDGTSETVGPIRGATGPQGPQGPEGPRGPKGEDVDFTVSGETLIITEV